MRFFSIMAVASAIKLQKDFEWTPPEPYWTSEPNAEGDIYRVTPPEHVANGEDTFQHSMYKNYASDQLRPTGAVLEDGTHELAPTGKHVISEADAKVLADEVVETHLGLTGDDKKKYIDEHFNKAYEHYDVNDEKEIEVGMAPQFTRMLLDDPHANIYSQGTKAKK